MRIKYLNNEITEEQFKRTLQSREKTLEKKREILQVLNTCVVVGSEILRRLVEYQHIENVMKEISELQYFTNESMEKISKMYNCVVPVFMESPGVGTVIVVRKY